MKPPVAPFKKRSMFYLFLKAKSEAKASTVNTVVFCLRKRKDKSRQQRSSVRKDVLRNFAKFKENYLCQSLFFNKVAGLPRY